MRLAYSVRFSQEQRTSNPNIYVYTIKQNVRPTIKNLIIGAI